MPAQTNNATRIEMKLEVVPIPVSDVEAAKTFYTEKVGFNLEGYRSANPARSRAFSLSSMTSTPSASS